MVRVVIVIKWSGWPVKPGFVVVQWIDLCIKCIKVKPWNDKYFCIQVDKLVKKKEKWVIYSKIQIWSYFTGRRELTSKPNFSCSVPILKTQNVKLAKWNFFTNKVPPFLFWFASRGSEILSRQRLLRRNTSLFCRRACLPQRTIDFLS